MTNLDDDGGRDDAKAAAIRDLNDAFRTSLTGGVVLLSAGIIALGAANQATIIAAVRAFDDFDSDDPGDLHAIGDLEVEVEEPGIHRWRELVFFGIDDLTSGNPANAGLLLTIMLASEW